MGAEQVLNCEARQVLDVAHDFTRHYSAALGRLSASTADGGPVGGSAYDRILFFFCMGTWSRTWTFQFLMVVVVSVVDVFSVYSQDRVQQRLVEQSISQQRLPSISLTFQFRVVAQFFILHRRLPVCWVRQNQGGFRTFRRGKKVRRWVRIRGRNWVRTSAHPRRRTQKSGGLGEVWDGASSCVSLRLLLEEFRRVFLSFVLAQFVLGIWFIISFVLASGSSCSGRLGVC